MSTQTTPTLSDPAGWTDADRTALDAAVAEITANCGAGMGDTLRAEVLGHHDTAERRLLMSIARSGHHDVTSDVATLAALGYQEVGQVLHAASALGVPRYNVAWVGLTWEQAEALGTTCYRGQVNQIVGWAREGLWAATPEQIAALLDGEYVPVYIALLTLVDPARGKRARQFVARGVRTVTWIESSHPLDALLAMREVLTGQHTTARALGLLNRGVAVEDVKAYGVRVVTDLTDEALVELKASTVAPRIIRSLHSALRWFCPQAYIVLGKAGVPGKDAKVYAQRMEGGSVDKVQGIDRVAQAEQIAHAHQVVPAAVLTEYAEGLRRAIRPDEVPALGVLAKHGYDTVEKAKPLFRANFRESGRYRPEERPNGVIDLAAAVQAGADETQVRVLSLAGIPLSAMADLVHTDDPWRDGAPFRAQWEAESSRMSSQWEAMHGPPRKWPHTQEDHGGILREQGQEQKT